MKTDRVTVALAEFARTLGEDFPIQGILDDLVRRMVDILPIDAAGVSMISRTTAPLLVAGSDEMATRYERLQTEVGEGPCVAAYETDEPILIPDLERDTRFPKFAEGARAEGLVAVFTFPLRADGRTIGALDLYRTTPGSLNDYELGVAQTLADVATAYLLNAHARQVKADFVSAVGHELRTPTTSIAGFVELLLGEGSEALTPAQRTQLESIQHGTVRLKALADDLTTLTSLEHMPGDHALQPLDLRAVISVVEAMFAPVIAARRLDVTFDVPETPVMVNGNQRDLESLTSNLMGNALKFTAEGGWVRCRVHTTGQDARLEVSDNGLGIPEQEQKHLFSRLFRSSTAHEHAIPGTGLGLTIVDSIAKHHGGEISVLSKHLGGTTFTVTLQLLEPADPPGIGLQAPAESS